MADPPSTFERMITNNGPVQISIMRNLTRWDFKNLQLAGVRLGVSRVFQRRHQIPDRCSERDPEEPEEQCANTTESFDEIRACAGHPMRVRHPKVLMKRRLGEQWTRPCLLVGSWWQPVLVRPWINQENRTDQPNTSTYPIHAKVCRRCRDLNAAELLVEQSQTIAGFRTPLCKQHSLEQNQLPLNGCRCFDYINNQWRCRFCSINTLNYLRTRVNFFRTSRTNARIPWSRPWAYLRHVLALDGLACPIEGCMQQPYPESLDVNSERMQLCWGCNAIFRI